MNRKGQVLATFLLLLPFLLILFVFVVDIGQLYVEKRKLENNVKEVIRYGLRQENVDETLTPKLENLLRKNIENIKDLDIMITNNNIKIHVSTTKKTTFIIILKKKLYEIKATYQGYLENEKIKIVKE